METKEPLNFILDIVKMAILQNRDADISKLIRDTVSALDCTKQERINLEPLVACRNPAMYEFEFPEVKPESPPPAVEKYVAPVPSFDHLNEEYDSLRSVLDLPAIESLPRKFETDNDTVAKINDRTVAMACEHYFDLLAVRDECKQLRDDIKSLRESTLQVFDTYVALRDFSDDGFYVHKFNDTYSAHANVGSHLCYSQNAVLSVAIGEVVKLVKEHKEQLAACAVETESPAEPVTVDVAEITTEPTPEPVKVEYFTVEDLKPSFDAPMPTEDASSLDVIVRVKELEPVEEVADDKPEVPF